MSWRFLPHHWRLMQRQRFAKWQYWLVAILAFTLVIILQGGVPSASLANPTIVPAQTLNRQGQQAFNQGDYQAALQAWQQAEQAYRQAKNEAGIWGAQLNQAKALHSLGFYRRAQALLDPLSDAMRDQTPDPLKVNVWLTQGQGLRLLGDLPQSQSYLEAGLTMAQGLADSDHEQTAHLYLGNTLAEQAQWSQAMTHYQQAAAMTGPLQLTAQLRQVQMLTHLDREADVLPEVQALVQQWPPNALSRQQLYAALELTEWLLQQSPDIQQQTAQMSEALLQQALEAAGRRRDRTAQSYANGYLGQWHEHQQNWESAHRLTTTALDLAQDLNADELIYQWQWQQGRIAHSQGNDQNAITHYTAAIDALQTLRQDLSAITRDVQFSFRDHIEPIYRDLVGLLLTPESLTQNPDVALEQARQTIENLQLAELNNFFREPCLEAIPQPLDTLDPTAAVLYPIILPDQLAVILSMRDHPLAFFTTPLDQADIETGIQQMLDSMRVTSFPRERLDTAQRLYDWLIRPAESILQTNGIQTLVFVLDGSLRQVPLAALHSGAHYLAEDYQIALSPGLQLLQVDDRSTPLPQSQALVGGLSTSRDQRPPLVGVKQEIDYIAQRLKARVLLDRAFTAKALTDQTERRSFDIVHLATHAQFGATDRDTFIQTWDGTLNIHELRQLIRQQDVRGLPPELLILSACDTAQGDRNAALGMAGLAVRAGTQATLATLWQVNDQATATFIQHFYDGLVNQNMAKAAAIRYAQQQLIQTSAWQHPYYWAPFVLVGNWQ